MSPVEKQTKILNRTINSKFSIFNPNNGNHGLISSKNW